MLSLPAQLRDSFVMERTEGGGGADDSRAGSPAFGSDLYAYVPAASGWSAPGCDRKLCGGGFVVSRPAAAPWEASPRYLWEHIPPRLAPRDEDDDGLLQLPSDDVWSADELDCELEELPATLASAAPAVTPQPQLQPPLSHTDLASRINVSFSSSCSASAAAPRREERRPLHHSGGGLTNGGECRGSPERPPPPCAVPQIEVVTPEPCRSASCSGRIKLEISAPCSSSVSVNFSTGRADLPCHSSHTPVSCRRHVAITGQAAAPSCFVRQASCCRCSSFCTAGGLPGPCAAPTAPMCHPLAKRIGSSEYPCLTPADSCGTLACEQAEDEMAVLATATAYLKESGWYYGMLSYQDAQLCMRDTAQGTFLVRDSFDRRFLFALTVQTTQGPTSVRVQFSRGRFRLDAPAALLPDMPTFANVNDLVERYARHGHVLYDQKGRPLLKMRLRRPLRRQVPSLQHCCRLVLHSQPPQQQLLPDRLRRYLQQYPFTR